MYTLYDNDVGSHMGGVFVFEQVHSLRNDTTVHNLFLSIKLLHFINYYETSETYLHERKS